MKKFVIAIIGISIVFVAIFFLFNAYIYQEKNNRESAMQPYRGTLTGEIVCLQATGAIRVSTDQCIQGLRTDVGEDYAIDFMLMSQEHVPIAIGDRITATGVIHPIELIHSDQWKDYAIQGTFSVTDSVKLWQAEQDM